MLDLWLDTLLETQEQSGVDVYDQENLEPFITWIEMMAVHQKVIPPFDVLPEVPERGRFPSNFKPERHTTESIRIALEGEQFFRSQSGRRRREDMIASTETNQNSIVRVEVEEKIERYLQK